MGQHCYGIMYGCELTGIADSDYDMHDRVTDAVNDFASGGRETGDFVSVVGIWVAVAGSGKRGAGDMPDAVKMSHAAVLASPIGAYLKSAEENPPHAIKFVERRTGVVLGAPSLWLLETETA